jgi:hypothetical protein
MRSLAEDDVVMLTVMKVTDAKRKLALPSGLSCIDVRLAFRHFHSVCGIISSSALQ